MMKRAFKMPTALTIVMIFLAIVAIMTWFVPTSIVVTGEDGSSEIIYNAAFDEEGNIVEDAGTSPVGLWDYFMAPVNGFIDAADIITSIFLSGGLIAILSHVGAMDAGIGALLRRFKGNTLIAILMFVFALMGTVYGSWEELPAYAIIILPLFISAGYDAVTGMMVILIAANIGNMTSIVNPYSIGAAVAAIGNPELSLGSGILLRLVLFIVMLPMGVIMVIKYANKVKKNPEKSLVYGAENKVLKTDNVGLAEMTTRRKWSLIVFGLVILFCVMGYIPWDSIAVGEGETAFDYVNALQYQSQGNFIGNFLGMNTFTEFGWWYFVEFSGIWLIGAVVIGFINKIPEKEFVEVFVQGAMDLTGVVFVLSASRGISLFMGSSESGMSITFIYWIEKFLSDVPLWAFVIAGVLAYFAIGLFLQSTSGVAGITMPIFGAVAFALFAGSSIGSLGGQTILLSTFTCGINFVCGLYPESTNMGICEMANLPYNLFFKQWLKVLAPVLVAGIIIISIAPYIGLV